MKLARGDRWSWERVVVSWHANSAPLLRARWQMHTGGRCTWPSAIRADMLIYHPQPWIIVLLSLSPYASAHAKNRISAFWFEARAESGSRTAERPSLSPRFTTSVTEILSKPCPQNVLRFFLLHLFFNEAFFIWLHPETRNHLHLRGSFLHCFEEIGLFMMQQGYSS